MTTEKFSKLYISLKFRLFGMGYIRALKFLEFCAEYHNGTRKDGVTPEFQHQLEIALFIMTLKGISDLENTLICALGHDLLEDYEDIVDTNIVKRLVGVENYCILQKLDKHFNKDHYFESLATCPIGSIVKLADRINNFQSMNRGKFTIEKQKAYAEEVKTQFLPMAKTARKMFPEQMDAYYNIETMLKNQLELINLFIDAKK